MLIEILFPDGQLIHAFSQLFMFLGRDHAGILFHSGVLSQLI